MKNYYLKNGNRVTGPFLLDDLKYQKIEHDTFVKVNEDGEWLLVKDDPDLNFLIRIQSNYNYSGHNESIPESQPPKVAPAGVFIIAAIVLIIGIGLAVAVFFGVNIGL